MDSLRDLIKLLEPNQKQFVPDNSVDMLIEEESMSQKSVLLDTLKNRLNTIISKWKTSYKLCDEDVNKLEILPIRRKNSLYNSILCLTFHNKPLINTFVQRTEMIDELIRFMISQMETNMKIKLALQNTRLRHNKLIEEIKNYYNQSPDVVYYLAILFDLNIIVLGVNQLELYYSDDSYDNCKPHILLYKDADQIYYPIFYKNHTNEQFLTYYDHQLIKCFTDDLNKKVICHKNYAKKIKTDTIKKKIIQNDIGNETVNYKNETAIKLRKIAENKNIDIWKVSEVTGRRIYKTKGELLSDLRNH